MFIYRNTNAAIRAHASLTVSIFVLEGTKLRHGVLKAAMQHITQYFPKVDVVAMLQASLKTKRIQFCTFFQVKVALMLNLIAVKVPRMEVVVKDVQTMLDMLSLLQEVG